MIKKFLAKLSRKQQAIFYVFLIGLSSSCLFSFLVYPNIASSQNLLLDPDSQGRLGYGLWKNHTFSYYPDPEPTLERGPLYPLFVAASLMATNGWWPFAVQLGQCILFALTCLLGFWITQALWNRPAAFIISIVCAVHPVLIWYTSRIWLETLSVFLFTLLMASILFFCQKPTKFRGLVTGLALAALILTKGTFLPFLLLVPVFVFFSKETTRATPDKCLLVFITATILITPWTFRNWKLCRKVIPVQARAAYNLWIGDELVKNFSKSPFSLSAIWGSSVKPIETLKTTIPADLPRYEKELRLDAFLLDKSLERYRSRPLFLLKKMAWNSLLFWTFGDSRTKSLVLSVLLIPLAVLVGRTAFVIFRENQLLSIKGIHLMLMIGTYTLHLPMIAIARYSVVLIPMMLIYALGPLFKHIVTDSANLA